MRAVALLVLFCAGACASAHSEGIRALDDGALEIARARFLEATGEDAEDAESWWYLGLTETRLGAHAAARAAFARVADLRPADPAPRVRIGMLWELDRNYDEADRAYRRAVEVAPSRAWPHRVLGGRLLRWGHAADAVVPLARATELDASHAATWNALGLAWHAAGDDARAEAAFRAGRRQHPRDRDLGVGLAALLVRRGRLAEALDVYGGLLEGSPRDAPVHVGRALVLDALGRRAEALKEFDRAVAVAADPAPYVARRDAYRGTGRR